MVTSREIRLKSHPVGMATSENFELATVSVSDPRPGEVQVKNLWMSVDPYMRGRMVARAGPVPAFRVSETFQWDTKGENAASNSVMYGWRPPFQLGEALQGGAIRGGCRFQRSRVRGWRCRLLGIWLARMV